MSSHCPGPVWSALLGVAHISISFPLPWAVSTHSLKKKYACYAFDIPFRGSSWPHWPLMNCPECTIASWTDFPPQDPQILPAAVFFVLWKDDSSSSGRVSPALSPPTSLCICLQVLAITWIEKSTALTACGTGVCWGPCWVLVCCIWNPQSACGYLLPWISIGLGQSLLRINKGHFIDCLFIPCLLYYDPTRYFQ